MGRLDLRRIGSLADWQVEEDVQKTLDWSKKWRTVVMNKIHFTKVDENE